MDAGREETASDSSAALAFRPQARWLLPLASSLALLLTACGEDSAVDTTDPAAVLDAYVLVDNTIISFDRATPSVPIDSEPVSGLSLGEKLLDIDIRPADGLIYALSSAGKLYTIDPATGRATFKSTLFADITDTSDGNAPYGGLSGTRFGIDFNPVPDRLRVVSDTGQNLRINVDTGATTTDGAISGAATGYSGAAYINNFAVACRTTLYTIDATSDRLLIQNPPNNGTATVVGPLGVDVSAVDGFDIATGTDGQNDGIAVLTVGTSTAFYRINLQTGAATLLADIPAPGNYVGLALPIAEGTRPQAAGDLYALTSSGKLISFNQAVPNKLCTSAALSGVTAADKPVGLDFRPSTGLLYALTNAGGTGRLYTLDPATGVASNPVTLSQPLVGADFGMDFNPTGPVALRIVSDLGQNLRVTDVTTGATTADTALNGAATGATAAAYTNSVANAGAGSTQLYVLDTANDRLRLQSPPNAGVLIDVGAFGVDVGGVNGFDIDGRNNLALAALQLGAATTSSLYTINLGTGAVSASLGLIGNGEAVTGLTRAAPPTTVVGLDAAGTALVRVSLSDATTIAIGNIVGLAGDANLVGIDFRPSTGILYGLGNAGGLYSIDPATAVASKVSTLAADASDTTSPYAGLVGGAFSIDFNPTGPVALRILSNTGQNLRVANPLAGNTFTDTLIGFSSFTGYAAAYTNSFPAPAGVSLGTQLYAIDLFSATLLLINPPNDGVVTSIGPLFAPGSQGALSGGFDIAAGDNSALAVMTRLSGDAFESFARLYRINLSTGAATEIGNGVTGAVNSLRDVAVLIR